LPAPPPLPIDCTPVMKRVITVIPARYGASRLPGKPLADIHGKPMIWWVHRRVLDAGVDPADVYVATDDERIRAAVAAFGGQAVMTSPSCASGSDRIAQAVRDIPCEFVLNVQGDEPLMPSRFIRALDQGVREDAAEIYTVVAPLTEPEEYPDPNVVKVALNAREEALYFSRSPLPYFRDTQGAWGGPKQATVYKHFGLYGYRKEYLVDFAARPESFLERSERLEQLRALEAGDRIRCLIESGNAVAVDTPADLERVRAILKDDPKAVR